MTTLWHARNGHWRRAGTTPTPVDHKPVTGSSNPEGQTFDQMEAQVGDLLVRRTFSGGFPGSFENTTAWADVAENRWSVFSFKPNLAEVANGSLDGALNSFINSIPAGHQTTLIIWHEPEDNIDAGSFGQQTWIDAQERFADLIHGTSRPELTHGICLMGWTLDPRSGRDANSYYPAPLTSRVDYMCWDIYNNFVEHQNWAWWDDDVSVAVALQMAVGRGKRLIVTEYGCDEHPDHPDWKPQWLAQAYDWGVANDAVAALIYFNTSAGPQGDPSRLLSSSPQSLAEFTAENEDSKT